MVNKIKNGTNIAKYFDRLITKQPNIFYNLTSFERSLFKIYVWTRLHQKIIRAKQKHFKGKYMIDSHLIQFLIQDILETKEYDLKGIAIYTNTTIEVLEDLSAGINRDPSLSVSERIMSLYLTVKRSFYNSLIRKILLALEQGEKNKHKKLASMKISLRDSRNTDA